MTTTCMLCAKDLKRSDNLNRHLALCHKDREEYVGYKECSNFTFSCVGDDYPHMFIAEKKGTPNQYVGYCTGCYKPVNLPTYTRTMESACKHIKVHTCVGKQTRTRKVVVTSEDASGNMITKKEMQTGGVRITAEMLEAYHKRDDMKHFEICHAESADVQVDVLGTIESALKQASKMSSPTVKALLTAPAAPVATSAASAGDGPVNWEAACKELASHRRIKTMMTNMMRDEQQRVAQSLIEAERDADADIEELDWYEFMAGVVYRANRVELVRKEKEQLLEKLDLAEGKYKRDMFELSERLTYMAKLSEERDEENRKLRAALQQCQSKIELIVDDKKF